MEELHMNLPNEELDLVLLIDDDPKEAQQYIKLLLYSSPKAGLSYQHRSPEDFNDFASYQQLINFLKPKAIILDQRLGEKSKAKYTGLDLAKSLRNHFQILPIFILTKYSGEDKLEAKGGDLDDIMDKKHFSANAETYVTRLLRAIGKYTRSYNEVQKRLLMLVQESFSRALTEEESRELLELRAEQLIPVVEQDLILGDRLQEQIDIQKQVLAELKKIN